MPRRVIVREDRTYRIGERVALPPSCTFYHVEVVSFSRDGVRLRVTMDAPEVQHVKRGKPTDLDTAVAKAAQ